MLRIAVENRSCRIGVGYGLELIISDAVAQQIIARMLPQFAAGRFFQGIQLVSLELVQRIEQEPDQVGKKRQ